MKNYIYKTLLCSALAMTLTTSCELDQYPEGSIPSEMAWQNINDAVKFQNGLLGSLRGAVGGINFCTSDIQSDLFNAMAGGGSLSREHQWRFTTSQFAGDNMWDRNYSLIKSANNVLDNIDKIEPQDEEEEAFLNNFKGEAYFARALGYANMAPRYCVNYDAATAASSLGMPLVTSVDVNAKPSRATLEATYNLILSDIENAYKLLSDKADFTVPNKDVVTALKARVSLYMKNYDEAIKAATSLFDKYELTNTDDYQMMWSEDFGTEIIYEPLMTVDERGGSYEGVYIGYNKAKERYAPSYVPTQGLMDLYEEGDVRKETYFVEYNLTAMDQEEDGYMFMKFPGNSMLRKEKEDETNSWYNMVKVFRASEMYLIAAEASLMKENANEAAALGYLNKLRTARGASKLNSTGAALIKDMKNEWTREMVGEGVRLDNLKRWGDGIKRMAPQKFNQNMLSNTPAEDYTKLNIQPNDPLYYKIIWEIPANDTQANSNLVPNWK